MFQSFSLEEQLFQYFFKEIKDLYVTSYHTDPRDPNESYTTYNFDEKKAKVLFEELKILFSK